MIRSITLQNFKNPRSLRELADLLKELVASKGCQFVVATHSPVLLNAFLKKKFYGRPLPLSRRCTELALEQLRRPDALDVLRQRPGFQHLADQLRSW